MGKKDEDFLKKLLSTFKIEAEEHLKAISSGLLELEKAPTAEKKRGLIEVIFREAHSLKGAARAVSMVEIEAICQSLESVFAALKRQEIAPSAELFDLLHQAANSLDQSLSASEIEQTVDGKSKFAALVRRLEGVLKGAPFPPQQQEPKLESKGPSIPEKSPQTETVRISTAKLSLHLLQAEELLTVKLLASQRASDLRKVNSIFDLWKKEWAKVQPEVRRIQQLLEKENGEDRRSKTDLQAAGLLGFLDWNHNCIKRLESELIVLAKSAEQDRHSIGVMVDNLLEELRKVLMLPLSSLVEIVPKFVRELSRAQGKEVELVIHGRDIEVDRRILEEMKDPLIHLVRNCVDHGIEDPKKREQKKKPSRGTVTIAISQKDGSKVEILISDDGAGVDIAKVRSASLKLGILSQEEAEKLSDQEVLPFIFQSGVSTNPIITDISGRGLGLAIVREKIEKLGGIISVETEPGIGSTFRILLPLTLATFRGVLVQAGEQIFVIPAVNVERVARIKEDEIKTVENKETIQLNGRAVSLVRLDDVLELPRREKRDNGSEFIPLLVLGTAEKRIAFSVDEVLNEQEVQVKSLGRHLSRVRNIAGATVLGTGKVVPILNVADLMKSAVKLSAIPAGTAIAAKEVEQKGKSILVAEDSITARALLKNILESAGYRVKTAVDGVDAFTSLKTEDFDLVVSDVDMPRMSGFDLAAKIRADKKLSDLPVVLVTALERREDRERGIDVGANAYIIKSSFDQSNLLEVIRRLI